MCSWLLIIMESKHTLTCAKCTSSPVRWIISGCGMWFLLSNVVCNGIPYYLETGRSIWERRPQDSVLSYWVCGLRFIHWPTLFMLIHVKQLWNPLWPHKLLSRRGHIGQKSAVDQHVVQAYVGTINTQYISFVRVYFVVLVEALIQRFRLWFVTLLH